MFREFHCIQDCSDCCIYRQYYPSVDYGKIGVLLLPQEKNQVEDLAKNSQINVTIFPRLGIGVNKKSDGPQQIIAYQLMGKIDGDYCPFLDIKSNKRSPNGGFNCSIYEARPFACRAYPVIKEDKSAVELDSNCKFSCQYSNHASKTLLDNELRALTSITDRFDGLDGQKIWRYATHVGEEPFRDLLLPKGWYLQP
jgi:Fe-S-cluster containining protein